MTEAGAEPSATVLVVDMANVIGSVPDGWWRDRAGAAARLLSALPGLLGRAVEDPDGRRRSLERIVAVLEGRAKQAGAPEPADYGLVVVRANGSGDDAIARVSTELVAGGTQVLVVTADRGLRARLPAAVIAVGPGWLNRLLGRARED